MYLPICYKLIIRLGLTSIYHINLGYITTAKPRKYEKL